jgi:hypothetical protein
MLRLRMHGAVSPTPAMSTGQQAEALLLLADFATLHLGDNYCCENLKSFNNIFSSTWDYLTEAYSYSVILIISMTET